MKQNNDKAVLRLRAMVQKEIDNLLELMVEQSAMSADTTHPRIIGSILHDFYTGIERVFQRIALELEGGIPASATWHKDLLDDMALEIPDVRPAIITDDLREDLESYLRFRHVFRGSYGFELEPDRMRPLFEKLESVFQRFKQQMATFLEKMTDLAQGLSDEA
jgi:hypothetical protein